ncbi:MAG: 30S ribosome-binding factor RbfA [Pseudomonadota bacterium]
MPARPNAAHARAPSQRQRRAGELVRHALVDIFAREPLREPALADVSVTVSEVRLSPDLKAATAFCAPLGASLNAAPNDASAQGGGADGDGAFIDALNRAAPHIRSLLAARVALKFTPALSFRLDESFGEARRIDDLLASPHVRRDLGDGETE